MARTSLATEKFSAAGLQPQMTAPTVDGDVIDSNNAVLVVSNASGASINVTVQTPATGPGGLAIEERIVAVAAGAVAKMIGPFPREAYGQLAGADKGRVYVNYSAQASVTRGVVGF